MHADECRLPKLNASCCIMCTGHGRSSGQRGLVESFDTLVMHASELVQHLLSTRSADARLCVMGHSMGGIFIYMEYIYMCIYIYIYICICIHICTKIHIYIHINVCIYICIHIHIYIHVHIYTAPNNTTLPVEISLLLSLSRTHVHVQTLTSTDIQTQK